MERMVIVALAGVLGLGVALGTAQAEPKKGKAKAAAHEAPQSAEIGKAMADLKWGMTRDQVMQKFTSAIKEKYKPLIAKATGAIEEDKLRAQLRDELSGVRESLVEFDGHKTGWDVSFLKGEFTHHNGESMFVVKDDTSQNYYFFIHDKLWKWYKAFNATVFQGKSFDEFAQAIQDRYGKAQLREGELTAGSGKQRWLEWQDVGTRLRAVDNTQFYGFYCLVFESKETLRRLPELRANRMEEKNATNAMVEAATNPEGADAASNDQNKDIVDRITGRIRVRGDAPEAQDQGEK